MLTHLRISRRNALIIAGYSLGMPRSLPALDTSEPAPRFSGKTMGGEAFNNQLLLGKVVLVEFWATWCPYCRSDAQPLDNLAREFEKDQLIVLAVDVGEPKKKVKAFLDRNPLMAKVVLMEDTNLAAVFAAKSFPHYVLDQPCGTPGRRAERSWWRSGASEVASQSGAGLRWRRRCADRIAVVAAPRGMKTFHSGKALSCHR